jgi:hypothetical protein
MDIDDILLDLEVINQVKEHDKLAINIIPGKKTLIVDNYSYFSPIKRWYYKYNRDDVISYLGDLLTKIENATNTINNGNHIEIGITLKDAINKSLSGLANLKNTYNNDSLIVAKIILLNNKLTYISNNVLFNEISLNMMNEIENKIDNEISYEKNTNLNTKKNKYISTNNISMDDNNNNNNNDKNNYDKNNNDKNNNDKNNKDNFTDEKKKKYKNND